MAQLESANAEPKSNLTESAPDQQERIKELESELVESKQSVNQCEDDRKFIESMERTKAIIEGLLPKKGNL